MGWPSSRRRARWYQPLASAKSRQSMRTCARSVAIHAARRFFAIGNERCDGLLERSDDGFVAAVALRVLRPLLEFLGRHRINFRKGAFRSDGAHSTGYDQVTAQRLNFVEREGRQLHQRLRRQFEPPATLGTMLSVSPAFTSVCSFCDADVFVVQMHVDEVRSLPSSV